MHGAKSICVITMNLWHTHIATGGIRKARGVFSKGNWPGAVVVLVLGEVFRCKCRGWFLQPKDSKLQQVEIDSLFQNQGEIKP